MIRNIACVAMGIIGAAVAHMFGGWSSALTTLCIFMAADYMTGLIVAGIFKSSPKTENGCLESRAGFKGLVRKGVTLLIVLIAHRLDVMMGTAYIKDAVTIAFSANELLSLTENAALMGVPMPEAITKAIEVMKK